MLEIDVRAQFGKFDLDAKLDVPKGVTALVGLSGAGKSSLLRLVAGLTRPDQGRVALAENVFSDAGSAVFLPPEKRRIGMVFQRPALVPHMSVVENILLGARGLAMPGDLLQRTGCAMLAGKPIAALSGGERQRVMLARALAGAPQLLLFDEPLSALDSTSKDALLALFAELFPTLGVPVIYVTHAMEEAGRVADRFALMQSGRVVAVGDATRVLSQYAGIGEGGVASILFGKVRNVASDGLADIAVGSQKVELMGSGLAAGDNVGLRLWARDVMLARKAPQEISARNALKGVISNLHNLPDGQVEVRISVEDQEIVAIIMARTVVEMDLAEAQPILAIFKSASIERAS